MACLFNSRTFNVNQYICTPQIEPLPYAVVGPFVEITIEGKKITNSNIGNLSEDGTACIKSFQYGRAVSNGVGFKVEIINETWDWVKKTFKALNKTKKQVLPDMKKATCEFGWVVRDCNNIVSRISNRDFGGELFFLVNTVESSFENGVYKISVECTDLMTRNNNQTQGLNEFGDDDNKMNLKNGLRKIWTGNYTPPVERVIFRKWDADGPAGTGGDFNFRNKDGGESGPWGTWQTKEKNKLSTTRNWLNGVNTENKRGIRQDFDNENSLTMVFQEDPTSLAQCKNSIGTYVVNGGNCSPVISFNPKINWILENSGTGAVSGGASSPSGSANRNDRIKANPLWREDETIGGEQKAAIDEVQRGWRPKSAQVGETSESLTNHSKATRGNELVNPIEAELTVQGNPKFAYNYGQGGIANKTMAIVVLNPAVIRGCTWIAKDPVNEILSNRAWQVMGVDHQITDGKYVTTFKVMLPAPNADLNYQTPLGGAGWKVENMEVSLGDKPG